MAELLGDQRLSGSCQLPCWWLPRLGALLPPSLLLETILPFGIRTRWEASALCVPEARPVGSV